LQEKEFRAGYSIRVCRSIQVERKGRVRQYNSTGFIGYRSIQVAGNSTKQEFAAGYRLHGKGK
jgi:hypothetical protein